MPCEPTIGSGGVAAGPAGATAASEVTVPATDRADPTGPLALTGAWMTAEVPSTTAPRLHSSCAPLAVICEAGTTSDVSQTAGMLTKTPLVAVRVTCTLVASPLA